MIVRGTAYWARLFEPDTRFKPCWKIDVHVDDVEAKRLKEAGVKIKRNDDDVFVFKIRRNVDKAKGAGKNPPPEVVDKDMNPFTQLIGNGSEVIVQFGIFNWSNSFGKGIGYDLQKVQVVNHIPYDGGGVTVSDNEVIRPLTDSVKDGQDNF